MRRSGLVSTKLIPTVMATPTIISISSRVQNMEGRVSSDQDLKLGDTLRYYQRDSNAAKALLVRRLRCLAAYEAANRNLEKARAKNKDVHAVRNRIHPSISHSALCHFVNLGICCLSVVIEMRTQIHWLNSTHISTSTLTHTTTHE